MGKNVRALLFGHVHAQRGYWEKFRVDDDEWNMEGECQYAKTTNDIGSTNLMKGKDEIQFIANSALKNDRTVQPFAKKRLVGKPRIIHANIVDGQWEFRDVH